MSKQTNSYLTKSVAIINSQSPYTENIAKEALDLALMFGSFEQGVSLFFHAEGVRQLVKQQLELCTMKDFLATFSALPFYDIEQLYVCQQSLQERGLTTDFHVANVNVLTPAQFTEKLYQHDVIFRF
jgi:tRNA 2-thiouridine synthesizing protein C